LYAPPAAAPSPFAQAVIIVYFRLLFPLLFELRSARGCAHAAASAWLSFNILFNYGACVRTPPGAPPPLFDAVEEGGVLAPPGGAQPLRLPPGARWCRRCANVKPALAHHCSICARCVVKMDHHCPWVNNCVGLKNYRYFFNFLAYLWAGCLYALSVSAPAVAADAELEPLGRLVHRAMGGSPDSWAAAAQDWRAASAGALRDSERSAIAFSFILAFAVLFALSALLGWHVYLVASAQTTIDFYGNREERALARREGRVWVNVFDLGLRRNWQEVFDERGALWAVAWCMPRLAPHRGSGLCFPMVTDAKH